MKVIIATPLFPPEIEDIANYSRDIATHLKENNQVQILTYAGPVEEIAGLEIFTINKRQFLLIRIFKYFIKLLKLAKFADIIYVQNSVAVSWPAILVKIITGRKVIINFIEDEAWKRSRHLHLTDKSWQAFLAKPEVNFKINLIRKLQAWTLNQADQIIVASRFLAQAVSESYHLPEAKLVVNYPVANAAVILPFEQIIKPNQILVFGRDFDLISQKVLGDFKLFFLSDKTLSKAEISYLINTSELIVYNLQSENFDNFLLDCVAAGKNILAHDTIYAQEIIGQSGVFIDFSNSQVVIEKIRHLLGGSIENKGMVNRFTWESHLNKLQEVFRLVVKK